MEKKNQNKENSCTVTLVFAKVQKGNVRKQIAEMLLHAWMERMETEKNGKQNC